MKLLTGLALLWKKLFSKPESEFASYVLADKLCQLIYPKYKFSEYSRSWLGDSEFFRFYTQFHGNDNYHSADRKFFLRNLLQLVTDLPGETAECGVYQGASSYLICDHFRSGQKKHFIFDSFQGLSTPESVDGTHWTERQFAVEAKLVRNNLAEFDSVEIFPGWIPDRFDEVADQQFCFVHIDVDLYRPTLDSVRFFYSRTVAGGIIVCDDYGFDGCPGARQAVDEFLHDKSESMIEVPTGQGFLVKKKADSATSDHA